MANQFTQVLDVITPEVFNKYMEQYATINSNIIQSGVAVADPRVSVNITAGNTLVNMPYWNDLMGTSQVVDDGNIALETDKMGSGMDIANVMYRGKAWGVNEMAAVMSGDDPLGSLMSKIGGFWLRDEQQSLMSMLGGLFGTGGALSTTDDGSGKSTNHMLEYGADIDMKGVLYAKNILGDYASRINTIVMHSDVYTTLQAQEQITTITPANTNISIDVYLKYRVIVDDALYIDANGKLASYLKNADGTYNTYMLGTGSIGRVTGNPSHLTAYETFRAANRGTDEIYTRRARVLHPYGVKWTNKSVVGDKSAGGSALTPSNIDLANTENWELVYQPKNVAIVALKHTVPDMSIGLSGGVAGGLTGAAAAASTTTTDSTTTQAPTA